MSPSKLIDGKLLATGEAVTVECRESRVVRVTPLPSPPEDLPWLAPGLVDIQINGSAGHDLNGPDPSPETAAALADHLRATGVTRFCPTIVTDAFDAMEARLRAIARACESDRQVDDAVLCIHLEGPFISPEDGPRGAHPASHVQPASLAVFDQLNAAAGERIGIVTLAPEVPGAMDLIAELSARGIVVALGHTGATRSQVREATLMGATLSTHLGNGAHAELPRHDNYLWEQLAADELWASFIPDGHHLPGSVLKAMIRAKGLTRSILVSDAIFAAGMEPGRYAFAGQEIDLLESGRVNLAGTPYLAGSGLSLPDGVARCHGLTGLPLVDCWAMASLNPLRLLGFRRAQRRLMPGFPARHIVRFEAPADAAQPSVVFGD
ncbi:MAG: N-acetylglucosamine-6-phosphate deacetylase [Armatimonadia bacterium]|nr:N-acetylglucosamine-6-phosphate deacetylase [Armatimonadia bacterium]